MISSVFHRNGTTSLSVSRNVATGNHIETIYDMNCWIFSYSVPSHEWYFSFLKYFSYSKKTETSISSLYWMHYSTGIFRLKSSVHLTKAMENFKWYRKLCPPISQSYAPSLSQCKVTALLQTQWYSFLGFIFVVVRVYAFSWYFFQYFFISVFVVVIIVVFESRVSIHYYLYIVHIYYEYTKVKLSLKNDVHIIIIVKEKKKGRG